jgi:hypothetical protein
VFRNWGARLSKIRNNGGDQQSLLSKAKDKESLGGIFSIKGAFFLFSLFSLAFLHLFEAI